MAKYQPKTKEELKALCDDLSVNLGDIDTSLITDMSYLFENSTRTNEQFAGIEKWQTDGVVDMSYMFYNTHFDSSIENWNVSKVVDMCNMFYNTPFNQALDKWDVSNVKCMASMFECSAFNSPIGNWNLGNCTDTNRMFKDSHFCQSIDKWDVSNIVCMYAMFKGSDFDQPLNSWNTSSVEDMGHMFEDTSFNQPLDKWNVSKVAVMTRMFAKCDFDQDISDWDISNVQYMGGMFDENSDFSHCLDWDISNVKVSTGVENFILKPMDFIDFKNENFSLSDRDKDILVKALKPSYKKYFNDLEHFSSEVRDLVTFKRDEEGQKYFLVVQDGENEHKIDISNFFKTIYRKDLIVLQTTLEGEKLVVNSKHFAEELKQLSVFDFFNTFEEYPTRYKKANAGAFIVFCGFYTYCVTIVNSNIYCTEMAIPSLFCNFTYEIEKPLDSGLTPDWARECFL